MTICFIWCVALHLHVTITNESTGKHLRNPKTFLKYLKYFDFSGLHFPVPVDEIPIFEKNNSMSINVFRFTQDRTILTQYLTLEVESFHVNLLLVSQAQNKFHYAYIKNLSNLLGKMGSKAKFFCFRCLKTFADDDSRLQHQLNCGVGKFAGKTELPPDGEVLAFRNHYALMKFPFTIYADLECFPQKVNRAGLHDNNNNSNIGEYKSSTTMYQVHEPHSYGVLVIDYQQKAIHKKIFFVVWGQWPNLFLISLSCMTFWMLLCAWIYP